MISFPTSVVISLCQKYGPQLRPLPDAVDGARIMLAIAAVESGAGMNCGPRHESAYDVNGGFWRLSPTQQQLVREFGSAAACSYGPWQMMYCNFSPTMYPRDCERDLEDCAVEFVRFFNAQMRRFHPKNLDEIGGVWNEGKIGPDPAYVAKLQQAYTATLQMEAPKLSLV